MKFYDLNNNKHSVDISTLRNKTNLNKSNGCQKLYDTVKKLWSQFDVFEEFPCLGTNLRLDIFIPLLKVAFEFDGKQHEEFRPFFHGDRHGFARSQNNDNDKERWCEINQIKLIRIKDEDLADIKTSITKKILS